MGNVFLLNGGILRYAILSPKIHSFYKKLVYNKPGLWWSNSQGHQTFSKGEINETIKNWRGQKYKLNGNCHGSRG